MTRLARGSRLSEPPWIRARLARIEASSPRNPGRSTPSRRSVSAGMPSSGSSSADRMCSASRIGLSRRWAVAWAATIASWAFWVNRSSCMAVLSWCGRRCPTRQRGLGWSMRSKKACAAALRLGGQVGRQEDPGLHVEVAEPVGVEARHPLAAQPEGATGLRARRDLQQDAPLEGLDLDLGSQECLLERQRQLTFEIGAAPGEPGVGQQADDHEQVAAARPAPGQPDACARVGASRDRDLESLAVDLDQAFRSVVGLGQADVGVCLVRRGWHPAAGAPGRSADPARGGRLPTKAHAGQDVLEAQTPRRACAPSRS